MQYNLIIITALIFAYSMLSLVMPFFVYSKINKTRAREYISLFGLFMFMFSTCVLYMSATLLAEFILVNSSVLLFKTSYFISTISLITLYFTVKRRNSKFVIHDLLLLIVINIVILPYISTICTKLVFTIFDIG